MNPHASQYLRKNFGKKLRDAQARPMREPLRSPPHGSHERENTNANDVTLLPGC
jgi:hypothetical protein